MAAELPTRHEWLEGGLLLPLHDAAIAGREGRRRLVGPQSRTDCREPGVPAGEASTRWMRTPAAQAWLDAPDHSARILSIRSASSSARATSSTKPI